MLALRILVTIFVGLSILFAPIVNISLFGAGKDRVAENITIGFVTIIGWCWRVLAIITVWVI